MITAIVLTKDRPAQLALLLESLERNGGGMFAVDLVDEPAGNTFQRVVERSLVEALTEHVCFMCDDGILYRPLPGPCVPAGRELLCFSLRLGKNTTVCYPSGVEQVPPAGTVWDWTRRVKVAGLDDFGYPGSVDGHVFRRDDLLWMLDGVSFPNPTWLELALVAGCERLAASRPLLKCFEESVYVGNPVNRVSEQSNVRHGDEFPFPVEAAKQRFARGERIDLDALDFSHVNGAHTEIELKWTNPVPA